MNTSQKLPSSGSATSLWLKPVSVDARQDESFYALLDADEKARAGRFHRAQDRSLYVQAHGWLRMLLSERLGLAPHSLRFARTPHGKPHLCGHDGVALPLYFSLSHTHSCIAIAISEAGEVGVDIEAVQDDLDVDGMLSLVLHPQEQADFARLLPQQRADCFFRWWTCKEAYVKALGCGLSQPLHQLHVELHADRASLRDEARNTESPLHYSRVVSCPADHAHARYALAVAACFAQQPVLLVDLPANSTAHIGAPPR